MRNVLRKPQKVASISRPSSHPGLFLDDRSIKKKWAARFQYWRAQSSISAGHSSVGALQKPEVTERKEQTSILSSGQKTSSFNSLLVDLTWKETQALEMKEIITRSQGFKENSLFHSRFKILIDAELAFMIEQEKNSKNLKAQNVNQESIRDE